MTGEIEAAGDVMTGGAVARAVEPGHGEPGHGDAHGNCLNCGTRLLGSHCHGCGQSAHVHRSLGSLWHDLAHGVFHFEGKIWRTLPMLVWRPGDLTRRYIAGERARFVSPLAMFLFLVFAMFAVVTSVGGDLADPALAGRMPNMPLVEIDGDIAKLEAQRKAIEETRVRDNAPTLAQDRYDKLGSEISEMRQARALLAGKGPGVGSIKTGWSRLDKAIVKANANPGLLLYKLQSNAYKYAWALIPLSVPFVWLMFFWYRGLHFYDHAIFVTYSLCFMMLLVVTLTIAGSLRAPEGLIATTGTFVPPIHLYRQLRGAYRCSVAGALLRAFLLSVIGGIVLMLFLMLLLALGLMG